MTWDNILSLNKCFLNFFQFVNFLKCKIYTYNYRCDYFLLFLHFYFGFSPSFAAHALKTGPKDILIGEFQNYYFQNQIYILVRIFKKSIHPNLSCLPLINKIVLLDRAITYDRQSNWKGMCLHLGTTVQCRYSTDRGNPHTQIDKG